MAAKRTDGSLSISKPIVEIIDHDHDNLEKYAAMLRAAGLEIGTMLPTVPRARVSFDIHGAYVELANGIRRALIEEIPVRYLDIEEADIDTNDEFIMLHMLRRSVNMIAMTQSATNDAVAALKLHVTNDTPDVTMVLAQEIKGATNCMPHTYIPLVNLRPGKYLKIGKFIAREGYGRDSMCTASLLNNVSYQIRGVEAYDNYAKRGKRSVEYDPDTFAISYETCGNCKPLEPLHWACASLVARLRRISSILDGKDPDMQLSVEPRDTYVQYSIAGFYMTESALIAKNVYLLDPNVDHVSASVARFDSQVAVVKIAHPQHLAIIKRAVEKSIGDIEHVAQAISA